MKGSVPPLHQGRDQCILEGLSSAVREIGGIDIILSAILTWASPPVL